MSQYTLTYEAGVKGWPSFYSFIPDMMAGMNQVFYSFVGGKIYQHNSDNVPRNNFYGVQYNSRIIGVINATPTENKLFKTIVVEGTHPWDVLMETDLQTTGFINSAWFEKKEASWFAFVRNSGENPANPREFPLRSLNGIGQSSSVLSVTPSAVEVNFSVSPLVSVDGIVSIGDSLYYINLPSQSPVLAGTITDVQRNYKQGVNKIIVDTTVPNGNVPSGDNLYFLYIKNAISESHGVLGHYCVFTITSEETEPVELFVIGSEVMKSYP
jgi:hypothetical protein